MAPEQKTAVIFLAAVRTVSGNEHGKERDRAGGYSWFLQREREEAEETFQIHHFLISQRETIRHDQLISSLSIPL